MLSIWRSYIVAGVTGLLCVSAAAAQGLHGYQSQRAEIQEAYKGLRDRPLGWAGVVEQLLGYRQPDLVAVTPQRGSAGSIDLVDLRIALLQLSLSVGSNDQLSIVRAQADTTPKVIAIQGGDVTLKALQNWLKSEDDAVGLIDGNLIKAPIVILDRGRLLLEPNDKLLLDQASGTFLGNFGQLLANGATIASAGNENPKVVDFRPFLVTAGVGSVAIHDSHLSRLGFGKTSTYSGFAVLNSGLYRSSAPSRLTGSTLEDVLAVTLQGVDDPVIEHSFFDGTGVTLSATQNALIQGNLFIDVENPFVIRVSDSASQSRLLNNVLLSPIGGGISVSKGSHDTVIKQSLIWGPGGPGIIVDRSDCSQIALNTVFDTAKSAIEIRTSSIARITNNRLLGSRSAGLKISDQVVGSQTHILNNAFVGNRIGLITASSGILNLHGNDLSEQFPRFIDGDLIAEADQVLGDLRGTTPLVLTTGAIEMIGHVPHTCTHLREEG